ncbi:glycosyltransferase family 4 protein [Vibrio mediterranei]|uniref:Glycosyltransferase family 1 protein n=1 Tax=Vibrio mediterranei TaxID=689 RepID=A0A3G4V8V3_9VIBR|nr:glycosyltransferase family 1 protein [Vibrio mediterranei]AYV21216.1 glycosyltransferase family 1 protein [Vibrio mediterranei]
MKIWLDYSTIKDWDGTLTGIPRTVYSIEQALASVGCSFERVFINDDLAHFYRLPNNYINSKMDLERADMSEGDILLSLGATWAYASYNEEVKRLKVIGVKYYQLYYDLIPTKFPYFYEQGKAFGEYYGKILAETLELCDVAFFISECSKQDICNYYSGENEFKKVVIRLGEDFDSAKRCSPHNLSKLTEDQEDFILCVGTLEKRKNQNMLLDAYRIMLRSHRRLEVPTLYLIGREGWMNGDLVFQLENDPLLEGKVKVLKGISDEELETLYHSALFTVFPSLYEGWGLPISESFKRGKACLASDSSSMVEIAPDLTVLLNPYAPREWAEKILELVTDRSKLRALTERIQAEYQPHSWQDTARTIIKEF